MDLVRVVILQSMPVVYGCFSILRMVFKREYDDESPAFMIAEEASFFFVAYCDLQIMFDICFVKVER